MPVRDLRRWLPVTVAGMTLLGLVAIGEAQASTPPGTNGKIAFIRFDPAFEGASQTFTIDPDGTHETQIPGGAPWAFACHGWSPEGGKLVLCTLNASGFVRPATANPDGSDFTLLDAYPNLPLHLGCERWSPDASRLLCQSDDESSPATNGIYTVRSSDGGDLVRVTFQPEGRLDMPVGYSPDGSRILFLRNDPNGDWGDLFAVNTDGSGLLRLNPARYPPVVFGYAMLAAQPQIEVLGEGSTGQTELSRARLSELRIGVPSASEASRIAESLEALDDHAESLLGESRVLAALRDALLPPLLSGELSLRDGETLVGAVV
jgi:hypothetical protein